MLLRNVHFPFSFVSLSHKHHQSFPPNPSLYLGKFQSLASPSFPPLPSLNARLITFPVGPLGNAATNLTPPVSRLVLCTRAAIQVSISRARVDSSESVAVLGKVSRRTTKARGCSVPLGLEIPTTAASRTAGWVRRSASSSAGATWKEETLMRSCDYECKIWVSWMIISWSEFFVFSSFCSASLMVFSYVIEDLWR